jgi:hypothetical protein
MTLTGQFFARGGNHHGHGGQDGHPAAVHRAVVRGFLAPARACR